MSDLDAVLAALQVAIQTEVDGHSFYRRFAAQAQDPGARAMFERLAQDESMHLQLLRETKDRLEAGGEWAEYQGLAIERFEGAPIFSPERVAQNVVSYTSDLSALRLAYLIEKDAVEFYTQAAELVEDPNGRTMFLDLAQMEQEHLNLLQGEYNALRGQFQVAMGFAPF